MGILNDVRLAVRLLAKAPSFSLVVLATLVLGIGANTAIFSVANAVLFRPLAVPDEQRLVRITTSYAASSKPIATLPHFNVLREQSAVFDELAAHRLDFLNLASTVESEQIPVARVTASFFRAFAARVAYGRAFGDGDDRPHAGHVVVLSNSIWVRRFGGDPRVVGRQLTLGSDPYTIVGVLPPFDPEQFDQLPDAWIPFQIDPDTQDLGGEFCVITGQLKAGITIDAARAQLANASDAYRRLHPGRAVPRSEFLVLPIRDAIVGNVRPAMMALIAAVTVVLLIACANIANLLLMRATLRQREMAIRTAIGASRGRLFQQLLTESLVLSLVGGALGLLVGVASVRALLAVYPESNPFVLANAGVTIPRIGTHGTGIAIDWHLLLFTVVASLGSGLAFGILPALHAARSDVSATLKQEGAQVTTARSLARARDALVVAQLAIALMLGIGAALLVRTSIALNAVDPGFDPHHVLTLRMSVSNTPFERRSGIDHLTRQGTAQLRTLPNVVAASTTCCVPFETVWQLPFTMVSSNSAHRGGLVGWTFVSPGYFEVLHIPIVRGRDFDEHDDGAEAGVVIINQAMAERYWPSSDPLGDSILVGRGVRPDYEVDPIRRVIGIVGNVRDANLTRNPRAAMYVPVAQVPDGVTALNVRLLPLTWIVRTRGEPYAAQTPIDAELRRVSGGVPMARVRSMDDVLSETTARSRFGMWLMTSFGVVATLLSAIGIYGLLAYSVQQRVPEIGIRVSLGADPWRVGGMILLQGMRLALAGITLGTLAAWNLAHLLASFLFGVAHRDPLVFALVPALLATVALAATAVPMIRAARIEPSEALRSRQ